MGSHLNRARAHFGTDVRGFLDGGRYALLHTRTMEFDDLRPYVPGDDVRDIDWRATARSGAALIRRFVSERHHRIVLVADAGANMSALAASGERKSDVAVGVLGAVGLITLGRSDEIGMVVGDSRGSVNVAARRGEQHVEAMLTRFADHADGRPAGSDIGVQLDYVARHYRHRLLLVVVSDEPDVDDRLVGLLRRLRPQHEVLWAMVSDMPAVGDGGDGYDVATDAVMVRRAAADHRVVAAYRRAEAHRLAALDAAMTDAAVPYTRVAGSNEIRTRLTELTEVYARAG